MLDDEEAGVEEEDVEVEPGVVEVVVTGGAAGAVVTEPGAGLAGGGVNCNPNIGKVYVRA